MVEFVFEGEAGEQQLVAWRVDPDVGALVELDRREDRTTRWALPENKAGRGGRGLYPVAEVCTGRLSNFFLGEGL